VGITLKVDINPKDISLKEGINLKGDITLKEDINLIMDLMASIIPTS